MRYVFEGFELDSEARMLHRGGEAVAVEPQVFDLIALLCDHAGKVVTRDEMIEAVWGGRIVSDSAISARIAAARKALGDDGKAQRVIKTVSRRGLQLVAAPREGAPPAGATARSTPLPVAAPGIRFTRSSTGPAIAYALSGGGPPVVRSYPGSHLEFEWTVRRERAVFDLVHEGNRLLRVDHVGIGLSEGLIDPPNFEDMAEDLVRAADAAGLADFIVFSESGGCHTALRLAALYPDRVRRLIIMGGYVEGRARRGGGPDFLRGMVEENWTDGEGSLISAFAHSYDPEGPRDEVMEHAELSRMALRKPSHLLYRDAINEVSNADILEQIRCPTLIAHSRNDAVHPLEQARKLAAGIADAELLVLESANHLPYPGHPCWGAFAAGVRAFLDADR